jgi:SAM-dependent methyltransferase
MHRALGAAVAEFVDLDGVHDVLDVATGTALLLRSLPTDAGLRLVGVDISSGMLNVARAELPDAELHVADVHNLPFNGESFDLVTCVTALHLLADAPAALAEWHRVLRPAGSIVLATFAMDPVTGARVANPSHAASAIADHAPFGTVDDLSVFAATTGLEVVRHSTWTFRDASGEIADVCLFAELAERVMRSEEDESHLSDPR